MNTLINKIFYFWKSKQLKNIEKFRKQIGAGTFHYKNILLILKKKKIKIFFLQNCFRQFDSILFITNRLLIHTQIQILICPIPFNFLNIFIKSIFFINKNIQFKIDNWNSPTLGAIGVGYEVLCSKVEISQITIFFIFCNKKILNPILEITYGIERIFFLIKKKIFLNERFFNIENYFLIFNIKKIIYNYFNFFKNYKKKNFLISYYSIIDIINYFNIFDNNFFLNNFNRIKLILLIKKTFEKIIEKL